MARHIDTTEDAERDLMKLNEEIRTLADMTIEMFDTTPATLLSPVFRRMILDHAKVVKELHVRLGAMLCVDAPYYQSTTKEG